MRTPRLYRTWLLFFLTGIAMILPVSAREKADVVLLKNGNSVACEVKNLSRGMLTVSTDSMGTVQIKWQDVEKITSAFLFTVQDTKGHIYVGSLQPAAERRHANIEGPRSTTNLDYLSIVRIYELGGSRWKRLSGSVDLSSSFTKASASAQLNLAGDIAYTTEVYSAQLTYNSTFGTFQGETNADRRQLSLVGTRQFLGKWLAYAQTSFEHNLELQLDKRYSFLGGPGYRITQTNRSLVTAIGAVAFTQENYFGPGTSKNAEGYFGIDAQFFKLYSPKFDIVNQFVFLPNFTTRGRRRIEFNSKLRLELLKDFFVTLTFYDSYDSKPPSETAAKNDYGLSTGISWSFRK